MTMSKIKRSLLFLFLSLVISSYGQSTFSYYLKIGDGFDLGPIQTTTNIDGTLTFSMTNSSFAESLNTNTIFEINKMYPTAQTPELQRVYHLRVSGNFDFQTIYDRVEVEKLFLIDETENRLAEEVLFVSPNDYDDPILGGRNTALDLLRTTLAWTITTGDPSVLIGVDDSAASLVHPDLDGQFVDELIIYNIFPTNQAHGIATSGIISAKTNNNSHVASLAYNSKLVFGNCENNAPSLINGLLQLAQYPGVRVVNCSWSIPENSGSKDDLDLVMAEIALLPTPLNPNPPLIIAAAGNTAQNAYTYPAAYDTTIGVTSVGHRFPIHFNHNIINPATGFVYGPRSWKDVHPLKPHIQGNTNTHTHSDKIDVVSPTGFTPVLTNLFDEHPEGVRFSFTTSSATPFVSGVAALVFSANPSLTAAEVRDIIKNTTDDIYHIPYNEPYIGLLGTGRINAYRAVKTADCMVNPSATVDLAMQNSPLDLFVEPDTETDIPWFSRDIWVRNLNDGSYIDQHQNPEYDPINPNYAYVRVTNNSCVTSSGTDVVKLYWAKANTALTWPLHWEGNFTIEDPIGSGNFVLMGDEVGTLTLPSLEIGESATLEFEWSVPNPEDYININDNPWHFCLLARIESADDPMTFIEGDLITENVINNNNIAWKNMTVIDIIPDVPSPVAVAVAVGNPYDQTHGFNLELVKEAGETGKAIYDEAEVSITLDNIVYNAWESGGSVSTNLATTGQDDKIIVENDHALIENLQFSPNEIGTVTVSFNFLIAEMTDKTKYVYHLIQRDAVTNEVIGGETFEIRKQPRDAFSADAGSDEEIDINESVTISAEEINETATYNWYDPDGNLIYSGTDLTVTPEITTTYQLEIVSDIDGFKDYDLVEVTVNPYSIESLVPNPTSSQVTINYLADGATSAYLMVVNAITGSSDNYILDTEDASTLIDVSTFAVGLYNVILVCDGEVQNSQTLVKQ